MRFKAAKDRGLALTPSQRRVLEAIIAFQGVNGYSPCYAEIGAIVGLSSLATVHKHIRNLTRKGWLECEYNRARSLKILRPIPGKAQIKCPKCSHSFEFSAKTA